VYIIMSGEKRYLMLKQVNKLMVAAFMVYALTAAASDTERIREFENFRCRLILPDPNTEWIDHTQIPGAKAALGDDSGRVLVFMVNEAADSFVLNDSFIEGFDESFNKPGVISKISGQITAFRNVPCYQFNARIEQDGSIVTGKIFAANGYLYQLQLIGGELPINERNDMDNIFHAFEFFGKPNPHESQPTSPEQQAYNFSRKMGRIIGYCIIVIIVVLVGKMLIRKKRKTT